MLRLGMPGFLTPGSHSTRIPPPVEMGNSGKNEHDVVERKVVIGYFVMLCRILVTFRMELEPGFKV